MTKLNRFLVALAMVASCCAGQTTIYVDSTVATTGTGLTQNSPFKTLAEAEALLTAGPEVIKLKAGSNWVAETLRLTNNDTVMRYGFGADPIIDATGAARSDAIDGTDLRNVLVQDVALTGATTHGWQVNGLAENVVLRRVHSYENGVNGFAHDDASTARGTVVYLNCKATENGVDGYNIRGNAHDICIRCQSFGHDNSGGSDDGYTTHDTSGLELWYCTSEDDEDAVHFTHGDLSNSYNLIVGCYFKNWTALGLNLNTSEVGGGILNTTLEGNATAAISISPGAINQVIDGCQLLGTTGGDMNGLIDGGGAQGVILRNSLLRMPPNTTQTSIYGIRRTSTGGVFAYNNTIIVPPDATETANYYGIYQTSGTAGQIVNNFFQKTDEPNAYFHRGDASYSQYSLVDGNVYVQVTTNNNSWWINSGGANFAALQALNKGVSAASTDNSGFDLAVNPTSGEADDVAGIENWRIPPSSYSGYGLGLNGITTTAITHKYASGYGQFGPTVRDGSSDGIWAVGPFVQGLRQTGSVLRPSNGRTIFAHATLNNSWSQSFKLVEGTPIVGDMTRRQGLQSLSLQTTAACEIYIHAGRWGFFEDIIWAGHSGTTIPIVVDYHAEPLWGPAGRNLYMTIVGSGVISGQVLASEGVIGEAASGGVPRIRFEPASKANDR